MPKEEKPKDYIPTPVLQLNEFEEELANILDLAKKEAAKIIQEAKAKAGEIIQKQKQSFAAVEKGLLEKINQEIESERECLYLKTRDELQLIENIPESLIKQAVDLVVKRVLG